MATIVVFVVASAAVLVDTRLAIGRIGESVDKLNGGLTRIEQRFGGSELARLGSE